VFETGSRGLAVGGTGATGKPPPHRRWRSEVRLRQKLPAL